jgi:hypothetical protein
VWGFHSEIKGKPYFDRLKLISWIHKFNPHFQLARFIPNEEYHGVAEQEKFGSPMPCLMEIGVSMKEVEDDNRQNTWRIYEPPKKFVPYLIAVDPAEGAEDPDAAADSCAAIIARAPDREAGEKVPKICAVLRSTLETVLFARVCSHAMRKYNNALLAAETKRHAVNATFAAEVRHWPYWFHMVTIQDSTQRPRKQKGWDTNASTRASIFDYIGSWISEYTMDEYPEIPDQDLLRELAACVVGKNGRPDHTSDGTLDLAVCLGIILYVMRNADEQIIYNGDEEQEEHRPFDKILNLLGLPETQHVPSGFLAEDIQDWR